MVACFGVLAVFGGMCRASCLRSWASAACCACVGMGDLSGVTSAVFSIGGVPWWAICCSSRSVWMSSCSGVDGVPQSGVGGSGAMIS